jgi:NADH-quinone oxidoreductase subunit C
MTNQETLVVALQAAFGPGGRHENALGEGAPPPQVAAGIDMPAAFVERGGVRTLLGILKNDPEFRFDQLSYLTATDELDQPDAGDCRFRIVYFLFSTATARRVKVHTRVPESDGPVVDSVVPLYLGANWMEREVFDMFGIRFAGHPELRRILMPEEYRHYPLRKDFPLEGEQPDRLYRDWERARAASCSDGHPS